MEKYGDKGFRIVAISPESPSQIKSVMIDDLGGTFWMGSDPSRETVRPFGGGGIPHAYLVDAYGKVAWSGHPASLQDTHVEKLLAHAFVGKLERALHVSLKSLVKAFEKGQFGKAWAGAARSLENEDRVLAADALYLREQCEAAAKFKRKVVETSIEARDYADAFEILKAAQKDFAGMEFATWAKDTTAKLSAEPQVKKEMSAWKAFEKLQKREMKAGKKEKKLKAVRKAYEKLAKKHAGTKAAMMAEKAAKRLP